jgi:hypothetical protein
MHYVRGNLGKDSPGLVCSCHDFIIVSAAEGEYNQYSSGERIVSNASWKRGSPSLANYFGSVS